MNEVIDRLLGSSASERLFVAASGRARLRVLAYHDVPDPNAFEAHMAWLVRHYKPVELTDVLAALDGSGELSPRAVWITFDDGYPAVVESGQAILDRYGIRATLFVCPGLIESGEPHWWQVGEAATALGVSQIAGHEWQGSTLVTYLKSIPDLRRREIVAELAAGIASTPTSTESKQAAPTGRQLNKEHLRTWLAGGHTIGNHTWDHPCLDRCDPTEQAEQIGRADDWLQNFDPGARRVFAYPNGDWTPQAEAVLARLGYECAALFDHRLARMPGSRLRVSRLRVSSNVSLSRFRSIVSGANPALFGLRRNLTPSRRVG